MGNAPVTPFLGGDDGEGWLRRTEQERACARQHSAEERHANRRFDGHLVNDDLARVHERLRSNFASASAGPKARPAYRKMLRPRVQPRPKPKPEPKPKPKPTPEPGPEPVSEPEQEAAPELAPGSGPETEQKMQLEPKSDPEPQAEPEPEPELEQEPEPEPELEQEPEPDVDVSAIVQALLQVRAEAQQSTGEVGRLLDVIASTTTALAGMNPVLSALRPSGTASSASCIAHIELRGARLLLADPITEGSSETAPPTPPTAHETDSAPLDVAQACGCTLRARDVLQGGAAPLRNALVDLVDSDVGVTAGGSEITRVTDAGMDAFGCVAIPSPSLARLSDNALAARDEHTTCAALAAVRERIPAIAPHAQREARKAPAVGAPMPSPAVLESSRVPAFVRPARDLANMALDPEMLASWECAVVATGNAVLQCIVAPAFGLGVCASDTRAQARAMLALPLLPHAPAAVTGALVADLRLATPAAVTSDARTVPASGTAFALGVLCALAVEAGAALAQVQLRRRLLPSVRCAIELVQREWIDATGNGDRKPIVTAAFRFAPDAGSDVGAGTAARAQSGKAGRQAVLQLRTEDSAGKRQQRRRRQARAAGITGAPFAAPPTPAFNPGGASGDSTSAAAIVPGSSAGSVSTNTLWARPQRLPSGAERHWIGNEGERATRLGELLLLPSHSSVRCANGKLQGITEGHREQLLAAVAMLRAAARELSAALRVPPVGTLSDTGTYAMAEERRSWPCSHLVLGVEERADCAYRLQLLPLRTRLQHVRQRLQREVDGARGTGHTAVLSRMLAHARRTVDDNNDSDDDSGGGGQGTPVDESNAHIGVEIRVWTAAFVLARGSEWLQRGSASAEDGGRHVVLAVAAADVTELPPHEAQRRWRVVVSLLRGVTRARAGAGSDALASRCIAPVSLTLALYDWLVCCFDICGTLWRAG